jgi:hypothetical protein
MKTFSLLAICFLLLSSCNGYQFLDISKFNIVDTALKNNEEIKLLYSGRGPDNNKDLEYYIQIIAVSQKTGDTVNILTPVDNGFSMDDKDKVFNYFDQNNIASKLILMDSEKLTDMNNVNEASKAAPKKIMKVARDPKFDRIANNNYPTVIGSIGTTSK